MGAKLNIDISPLCKRENANVPLSQIAFIEYVLAPTFTLLGDLLDTIEFYLEYMKRNEKSLLEKLHRKFSHEILKRSVNRFWLPMLDINKCIWRAKHVAKFGLSFESA